MIARLIHRLVHRFDPTPAAVPAGPPPEPEDRTPPEELRARFLQAQNAEVVPPLTRELDALARGRQ